MIGRLWMIAMALCIYRMGMRSIFNGLFQIRVSDCARADCRV